MKYFLDTSICIYFLKGIYPKLVDHFQTLNPNEIKIPSIVKADLLYGAEKSKRKSANLEKIMLFLLPYEIIPFGNEASLIYAGIRSKTEAKGHLIGPNDLIIASVVLANYGTLITKNVREFSKVPQLKIKDWTV